MEQVRTRQDGLRGELDLQHQDTIAVLDSLNDWGWDLVRLFVGLDGLLCLGGVRKVPRVLGTWIMN